MQYADSEGATGTVAAMFTLTDAQQARSNDGQALHSWPSSAKLAILDLLTPLKEALVRIALNKPACRI